MTTEQARRAILRKVAEEFCGDQHIGPWLTCPDPVCEATREALDHYPPDPERGRVPVIAFFAAGEPVPQGSKRAWLNQKTKRVMMTEDQGTRHTAWRHIVTSAAAEAMNAATSLTEPISVPVTVALTFSFHRGVGHYGSGRNERALKDSAPDYPSKPPDVDKLIRAVLDSITDAMVWTDDSLVVSVLARKRWVDRWTEPQGVKVVIGLMPVRERPLKPEQTKMGLVP